MRLLSFVTVAQPDAERVGAMLDGDVIDLCAAQRALGGTPTLPRSMKELLGLGGAGLQRVAGLLAQVKEKRGGLPAGVVLKQSAVRFLPPVTNAGKFLCVGKNIPGFGPLGPCIVTMDEIEDPYDLWMTCSVNGEPRMRVNTRDQIWKLPDILEHFTRYIPFEPGDMFSTGAPGGVAVGKPNAAELFLKPGDVVECAIEGVMTLTTRIVAPA